MSIDFTKIKANLSAIKNPSIPASSTPAVNPAILSSTNIKSPAAPKIDFVSIKNRIGSKPIQEEVSSGPAPVFSEPASAPKPQEGIVKKAGGKILDAVGSFIPSLYEGIGKVGGAIVGGASAAINAPFVAATQTVQDTKKLLSGKGYNPIQSAKEFGSGIKEAYQFGAGIGEEGAKAAPIAAVAPIAFDAMMLSSVGLNVYNAIKEAGDAQSKAILDGVSREGASEVFKEKGLESLARKGWEMLGMDQEMARETTKNNVLAGIGIGLNALAAYAGTRGLSNNFLGGLSKRGKIIKGKAIELSSQEFSSYLKSKGVDIPTKLPEGTFTVTKIEPTLKGKLIQPIEKLGTTKVNIKFEPKESVKPGEIPSGGIDFNKVKQDIEKTSGIVKTETAPTNTIGSAKTGQPIVLNGYYGKTESGKDSGFRSIEKDIAESYSIDREGKVIQAKDTLKNPFVAKYQNEVLAELAKDNIPGAKEIIDEYSQVVSRQGGTNNRDAIVRKIDSFIKDELEKQGYDGVIYQETKEYQAFYPTPADRANAEAKKLLQRKESLNISRKKEKSGKPMSLFPGINEGQYENFRTLVRNIPSEVIETGDYARIAKILKSRGADITSLDNSLYSGEKTGDEVLEMFKEKLFSDRGYIAKGPSEKRGAIDKAYEQYLIDQKESENIQTEPKKEIDIDKIDFIDGNKEKATGKQKEIFGSLLTEKNKVNTEKYYPLFKRLFELESLVDPDGEMLVAERQERAAKVLKKERNLNDDDVNFLLDKIQYMGPARVESQEKFNEWALDTKMFEGKKEVRGDYYKKQEEIQKNSAKEILQEYLDGHANHSREGLESWLENNVGGEKSKEVIAEFEKNKKSQKDIVVVGAKNWRDSFDKKGVWEKKDTLESLANMKSTDKELNDVLSKLEEISKEIGTAAIGIANDVSQNKAASQTTIDRAMTIKSKAEKTIEEEAEVSEKQISLINKFEENPTLKNLEKVMMSFDDFGSFISEATNRIDKMSAATGLIKETKFADLRQIFNALKKGEPIKEEKKNLLEKIKAVPGLIKEEKMAKTRLASPAPSLERGEASGLVIEVESFGRKESVPFLTRYKGKDIVMLDKDVAVWDPKNKTLFRVGMDDSKTTTGRVIIEKVNTIDNAKRYIDWLEGTKQKEAISLKEQIKSAPGLTDTEKADLKQLKKDSERAKETIAKIEKDQVAMKAAKTLAEKIKEEEAKTPSLFTAPKKAEPIIVQKTSRQIAEEQVPIEMPKDFPIKISPDDIDYDTAYKGNSWVTMNPERAAVHAQRDYIISINNFYEKFKGKAKTDAEKAILKEYLEKFKAGYITRENAIMSARSRVSSPMIAGPANFNYDRNRKRQAAEMAKIDESLEWQKNMEKWLNKALEKSKVEQAGGEIGFAEKELKNLVDSLETMKKVNKIVRKNISDEAKKEEMLAAGISEKIANASLEKDYMGKQGFPSFSLTSVNGKIKRLQEKIDSLNKKDEMSEKEPKTIGTFAGAKVVVNYELDRIQIFFDEIPKEEVRTELKSHGWRWSPAEKAWQRKVTGDANYSAKRIMNQFFGNAPKVSEVKEGMDFYRSNKNMPVSLLREKRKALKKSQLGIKNSPIAINYKKTGSLFFPNTKITSPADVAFAFKELKNEAVEHVFFVGVKNNKPIFIEPLSIGVMDSAQVDTFEPINLLLNKKADGFWFIHNHPSGAVTPSDADISLSKRVKEAYKKLGIEFKGAVIIDHTTFGHIDTDFSSSEMKMPVKAEKPKEISMFKKQIAWDENIIEDRDSISNAWMAALFTRNLVKNIGNKRLIIFLDTRNQVITSELLDPVNYNVQTIAASAASVRSKKIIIVMEDSRLSSWNKHESNSSLQKDLGILGISLLDVVELGTGSDRGYTYSAQIAGNISEKSGVYETGSAGASVGELNPDISLARDAGPGIDQTKTNIEVPEMLKMYKELSGGKVPFLRQYPKARGMFYGSTGKIGLNPSIFNDPNQAAATFAHEIGHMIDWLPDHILRGGSGTIGRMIVIKSIRGDLLTNEVLLERRAVLLARITRARTKLSKEGANEATQRTIDKAERELEVLDRKVNLGYFVEGTNIKEKELHDELFKLSDWWRPIGENPSKRFLAYRNSAAELYADFISVLFNKPEVLPAQAPMAYKLFFDYLDRKPDVKIKYFDLMDHLNGTSDNVFKARDVDIEKMFKEGEQLFRAKMEQSLQKRKSLWFQAKYNLFDKNIAIIEKFNQAKKEGKIKNPENNPVYLLEEYNYIGNETKLVFDKFNIDRQEYLQAGLTDVDFGKVLFLKRVMGDRSGLANPLGHNPETAAAELLFIEQEMGSGKFKIISEKVDKFNRLWKDEVLKRPGAEDFFPSEMRQKLIESDNPYGTFQVNKHILEGFVSPKMMHQVGTMDNIANPLPATMLKMAATIRAIETNNTKIEIANWLKEQYPEEIIEAKINHKTGFIKEKYGYGVWRVREGGKTKAYYVDEYIAKSMEYATSDFGKLISSTVGLANRAYFKPVYVTFNIGFQSFNLFRDMLRTWKALPNASLIGIVKRYIRNLPTAKARAFGIGNETIREMEKNKAFGMTFNDILLSDSEDIGQTDRLLSKYHILKPQIKRIKVLQPIVNFLENIKNIGDTIESLPKIVAYEYLKEKGRMSEKEISHLVRTRIGTPDFMRRGASSDIYNNVFLFSNIIKEGYRSDFETGYSDPKTRSGYWYKSVMLNFIPKLLMFAAAAGLLGEELKKMMDKITEYDKTNYTVIPISTDNKGNVSYIRIPQDETGRFLGGILWKSLMSGKDQSLPRGFADILSYSGGQLPSLTPVISIPAKNIELAMGQNPRDSFRQQNILTDDEMIAGGWRKWEPMLKWNLNQLGLLRVDVRDRVSDYNLFENTIKFTPVLNRWIKSSQYGLTEQLNKERVKVEKKEAVVRLERKEAINKYAQQWFNGNRDIDGIISNLDSAVFGGQIVTQQQLTALHKTFVEKLLSVQGDPRINSVLYAATNEQKKAIIRKMKQDMSADDLNNIGRTLLSAKVISIETWNEAIGE